MLSPKAEHPCDLLPPPPRKGLMGRPRHPEETEVQPCLEMNRDIYNLIFYQIILYALFLALVNLEKN